MGKSNYIRLYAFTFLLLAAGFFLDFKGAPQAANSSAKAKEEKTACFLAISDVHLHNEVMHSDEVTHGSDTGKDLWDSTKVKISSILSGNGGFSKPTFIIVLGDITWHTKDRASAVQNIGIVLRDLRKLAESANIPLIYAPGNNDAESGNYHAFSENIFNQDADCKTCWPAVCEQTDKAESNAGALCDTSKLQLGCYSTYPLGKQGGLRVVALNTVIFVPKYKKAEEPEKTSADATAELNWLGAQLDDAALKKEKVLIGMHVPPGKDFTGVDIWDASITVNGLPVQNAFLDLMDKHKNEIVGLLGSHTHMDGIRKLYDKKGDFINLLTMIPGITPGHGNNPSFKVITYNPGNFVLEDFTTYYMKFFPDNTVKSWGNASYNFNTEAGCPTGKSLKDCVGSLNESQLDKTVESIYSAKHETEDKKADVTIDVKYQ